jgi:hypothetical protein
MSNLKKLYLNLFIFVYALYAYFNKGIAYSFLVEGLLVLGFLVLILERRSYGFPWNRKMRLLVFFILLAVAYMFRGVASGYSVINVIRDSFMLNYAGFTFILFLYKDHLDVVIAKLAVVYKWFPLVACISFLSISYIPFFEDFVLFGDIHFLHYKYGDMAVHLLIATLLLLNGYIKMPRRFMVANAVLIVYAFLVSASYSRAGMVCFMFSAAVFYFCSYNNALKKQIASSIKFVPVLVLLALPLYVSTNPAENFQGRKVGFSQLSENITSIISPDTEGTLNDNKMWRLVWWAKILSYTFGGEYFIAGKGLGMSLAVDDDIPNAEEELRAPHNFHLNILGRFGVPVFFLWLYWIYLNLKGIRKRKRDPLYLILQVIFLVFILNATFDVFLEGPMGAFPFWTFTGIMYAMDAKNDGLILQPPVKGELNQPAT